MRCENIKIACFDDAEQLFGMSFFRNTNEIINEINKSIVDGKVEIVEDTLEGEIYIDGEIKGILDDYSWLFSNLGIDSIDMIMSNFQEPYNFNISTEIEGLN